MEETIQSENEYWNELTRSFGESFVQDLKTRGELQEDLANAKSYLVKLKSLRKYYESSMDSIMKSYDKSKFTWASSYPTDWSNILTDIEFQVWSIIRTKGRLVLYPQFPVDHYFVDFANPGLKIGLEIKKNSIDDPEKKQQRDDKIKSHGYTIYEVSGKEMYRTNFVTLEEIDFQNDTENKINEKLEYWLLETGDGVIQAIKEIHFSDKDEYEEDDQIEYDSDWTKMQRIYKELCFKTLEKHKV